MTGFAGFVAGNIAQNQVTDMIETFRWHKITDQPNRDDIVTIRRFRRLPNHDLVTSGATCAQKLFFQP